MLKKVEKGGNTRIQKMAPALGFEPRTKWLTATYSTAELCRSVSMLPNISSFFILSSNFQEKTQFFLKKSFFLKIAHSRRTFTIYRKKYIKRSSEHFLRQKADF